MTKKANVPAVRFKGFSEEWEQREFSYFVLRESAFQESSANCPSVEYEDVITEEGRLNKDVRLKNIQKTGIKFDGTQVLYGKLRPYLHNWLNPNFMGVAVGDWWVLRPVEMDKNFLYRLIQTEKFDEVANQSSGSKMPRADWNLVSNTEFIISDSMEEQQKIGLFFNHLDNLIAQQQHKLDKLRQIKKALLEKMFPQHGADTPEIRFKGFADVWEQHKLNYYLTTSNEKNINGEFTKTDVLSVSGEFGIVNQIAFQGRSFAGVSVLNYGIVHTGDIVYTKSPLQSNPFGIIKTNKGQSGIVSTLYAVYHPEKNVFPPFVQIYFEQNARVNNYLHPLVNKGAKNDMKVTADNALKGFVQFPNLEEQRKTGQLFAHLDKLITLHQRKLDKLKQIKKALLAKMFAGNQDY